jgi:hypothetical protein
VPGAAVAASVGTEFDPAAGRGGSDGTPIRSTPRGVPLGGACARSILAEHERQMIAPGGDVIQAFIPKDRPVLILMYELINFVSHSAQTYGSGLRIRPQASGRSSGSIRKD